MGMELGDSMSPNKSLIFDLGLGRALPEPTIPRIAQVKKLHATVKDYSQTAERLAESKHEVEVELVAAKAVRDVRSHNSMQQPLCCQPSCG